MAEKLTLARPYAQAAFEIAREKNQLAHWSEMLEVIVTLLSDPAVKGLIGHPKVAWQQLADLVLHVAGDRLDEQGKNFVRVLAANRRLNVAREVADLFNMLRAQAERTLQAEIVSAYEVTPEQEQMVAAALKKKFGREVRIHSRLDKSLIGGAVIRAEDMVIDGSITGQLDRLAGILAA